MVKNNQNVVLIVVDALRAKSLGAYGKKPSHSLTMDKLTRDGIIFNNAYTTALKTDPVTSSLMTGLYPINNGLVNHESKVTDFELNNISKQRMLAETLKEEGYYTAAVDWLSRWYRRGFDYYSGWLVTQNQSGRDTFGEETFQRFIRIFDLATLHVVKRDFLDRIYYSFNNPPYDPADVVAEDAIKTIKANKRKNFFLYAHFWDPHYPYVRPRGLRHAITNSIEQRYLSEIEFVDSQIKKIVLSLKDNGLTKKTLLIIIGDHGESLTEHGIYVSHRGVYEETVKIPMIFYHPSLKHKTIEGIVQIIDIVPTILDFLGIQPKEQKFDGKSLLPLINGKKKRIRNFAFVEDLTPGEFKIRKNVRRRALRTDRYKYIQSFYGPSKFLFSVYPQIDKLEMKEELYDLKNDPTEKNNLAKKQKDLKDRLQRELDQFIKDKFNSSSVKSVEKSQSFHGEKLTKKARVKRSGEDYDKDKVMKKFRQMGYW